MKRNVLRLTGLVLVAILVVAAWPVLAASPEDTTLEVSLPIQVTSNSYYERGQSIVYDGTDYWLFYARSASVTGNYGSGNPDTHDYAIYYKKAGSVAGLASASPILLPGTNNYDLFLGETAAAVYGGNVWVFGSHDRDGVHTPASDCDVYGWYYNGTTWTEVGPIVSNLSDGAAHIAATAYGTELWLAYVGWNTITSTNPTANVWSAPKAVGGSTTGGNGDFYIETDLYFAVAQNALSLNKYDNTGGTWSEIDSGSATGAYDATVLKVGSNYLFAYAPWVTPKQWIEARVHTSLTSLLSSGTTVQIAGAQYDTNTWINMWPTGFIDNGNDEFLFYTSERDASDPLNEGTGNIWYLDVGWDVTNDHYTYIQEAIDAATSTTINVAAGTYTENIEVDKSLTLEGAQAGFDARGRSATESELTVSSGNLVTIEAIDVVIDGFKLTGSGSAGQLIRCENSGGGLQFLNNIVGGTAARAFWFNLTSSGVTIEQNVLDGASFTDSYPLAHFDGSDVFDNLTIKNNEFYNGSMFAGNNSFNSSNMSMTGNLFDGALFNFASQFKNSLMDGNTFRNNGYTNGQLNLKDSTISNNTFEAAGPSPHAGYPSSALMLFGTVYGLPSENLDITNNTFYYNSVAAPDEVSNGLRLIDGNDLATIHVNYNKFVDGGAQTGAYAVLNQDSGGATADCSGNWWDDNTPAGIPPKLSGLVDYTPWLADGTDQSGDPGFQPDLSYLHVDDDSPQTGTVGRIQEGVNMVTASTVEVEEGTYVEQVVIDKDLTLIGHGSSSIIQSPTTLPVCYTTSAANCPVVYVHDTGDVTIEDLVVDGDAKGNTNYRFIGVAYYNAGGTVDAVEITDVRDEPFSGAQHGVALYGYAPDSPARSLTVTGCDIHDFQKNAMALNGEYLTVDVNNNTTTGYGATTVTAQNGIQVGWGASGDVGPNNTVSDVSYTGGSWTASGILAFDGDTDVTDNSVSEAQTGIYHENGNGTISGNFVAATAAGIGLPDYYGILSYDPPAAVPSPFGDGGGEGQPKGTPEASLTVNVTGNTLIGGGDSTTSTGLDSNAGLLAEDVDFGATENFISGWGYGVGVWQHSGGGIFTSLAVNDNCMWNNSAYGMYVDGFTADVDGEDNWWGDASGPYNATSNPGGAGDKASDYIDFVDWETTCTLSTGDNFWNQTQNTFYATLQAAEDAANEGDVIVAITPGPFGSDGSATVDTNGLTLMLNGATFGPGSSWLVVSADDVTVLGPGIIDGWTGTANSTFPGIEVQDGADNFALKDAEVKRWADGVAVAGSHASFKVVSNWLHSNTDAGLDIASDLSGVVTIEGNLFKANGGTGLRYGGAGALDATYNSWGKLTGPVSSVDYVGTVTATPWTYVEYYMDMVPDTDAAVRDADEGDTFDVALKADAENLYGFQFMVTWDTVKLSLNSASFTGTAWDGLCTALTGLPTNTIGYRCYRSDLYEWDATGGTIMTLNYTADLPGIGTGDDGPWTAYFDILHEELDTNAGAIGGVKVFVNNAGFNDPSASPDRGSITDTDDGRVEIDGLANYAGYIDLQGRIHDTGGTLEVYNQQLMAGSTKLASGTSVSSGYYATVHETGEVLTVDALNPYWLFADAPLYLPTTALATCLTVCPPVDINYQQSALLNDRPLTALNLLVLLGGDATDDDVIELGDATCIGSNYAQPPAACGGGGNADVNADGVVDILDLVLMGGNYTKNRSEPWVP